MTLDRFQPFSWMHAASLAGLLGLTLAAVALRRRRDADAPPSRWEIAWVVFTVLLWIAVNGWQLLPGRYDPRYSLPLQICDLVSLAVPLALLTSWRPLRALLYFWGLALSTQGILTPDLKEGPSRPQFWAFWIIHGAIIGTALYDLAGRRYRPTWKDFRYAYVGSWVYFALILSFDLAFGYNYGYVGKSRPDQPSLIDFLGPWPQRLVAIILLVSGAMLLLLVPWEVARKLQRSKLEERGPCDT
jgi:hypothetical integral membrane protein (TIGR02206 family)